MPSFYRDPDAPEPNARRRVGAIALIERDGAVLMQRRADDGVWDFIGGKLEENETVLAALRREVLEESGLRLAQPTLFGLFSDPTRIIQYPDGTICRVLTIVFRAVPDAEAEPVQGPDALELRFVPRDEVARLDLWPVMEAVRDAYLADPGELVVE